MSQVTMQDKVVVVTGASDGIGAYVASVLAGMGARVTVAGRDPEKTRSVAAACGAQGEVCDFSRLEEVRELAGRLQERHEVIDVLINNAGGIFPDRRRTEDGFELTLQVNHLAPFLLTNSLQGPLMRAAGARVVTTASMAHKTGSIDLEDLNGDKGRYRSFTRYGTTKLMNIVFANELSRRMNGTGVTSNSVHPGVVATSFARDSLLLGVIYRSPLRRMFLISTEEGARPLVRLATSDEVEGVSGMYFDRMGPGVTASQARDDQLAKSLWERSAQMVGLGA